MSPERAVQLWGGHGIKSRRSSGLSSRENSALTLTDSDNEHKSDDESAYFDDEGDDEDEEDLYSHHRFSKCHLTFTPLLCTAKASVFLLQLCLYKLHLQSLP
ncbi:teneurin-1-like [Salmo salar]|uniref:Teneurin-1-like n=1 Tax=Salmo salar TaxID=8030 RepID=A0ABM3CS11_SALSA|nr:teneurin-1-like [Salmo salar]